MDTLIGAPGIETTSFAFRSKLCVVAARVEVEADHLVICISFESDHSFLASKRNPFSGAVGLIQFIEPTANRLGTTRQILSEMSAEDQLDYVEKYFEPFRGRLKTLPDTYFAIFSPAFIGHLLSEVMYRAGEKAYEQNQAFDRPDHVTGERKGTITCGDVSLAIRELQLYSAARPRVPVSSSEDPYA